MGGPCRTCHGTGQTTKNIFIEFESGKPLYEIINNIYKLEIAPRDGLPKQVCDNCHQSVIEFHRLKRTAHEGYAALERIRKKLIEHNCIWIKQEVDETLEEDGVQIEDKLNNLCRICVNESGFHLNIFQYRHKGVRLFEVINELCRLNVSVDDDLPAWLCQSCFIKVIDFYNCKCLAHGDITGSGTNNANVNLVDSSDRGSDGNGGGVKYRSRERTSPQQLHYIADYMMAHPEFASGRFLKTHGKRANLVHWDKLAGLVNSLCGPKKQGLEWKKVWADLKCSARSRASQAKSAKDRSGANEAPLVLSDLDQKVLHVIRMESSLNPSASSPGTQNPLDDSTTPPLEPLPAPHPPSPQSLVTPELTPVVPNVPAEGSSANMWSPQTSALPEVPFFPPTSSSYSSTSLHSILGKDRAQRKTQGPDTPPTLPTSGQRNGIPSSAESSEGSDQVAEGLKEIAASIREHAQATRENAAATARLADVAASFLNYYMKDFQRNNKNSL
ncbi:uncharacterized protein [Hetaerina americana]|uniref:uncharacterized protein isoform X2 n=1 Tax=Hetaerina americana TaxID=62018 RepID=UPI003A7F1536